MDTNKLNELLENMNKVHERAKSLFEKDEVPAMLKNEYKNKVSQYDGMYESIEMMKSMTTSSETIENLYNQQIEILNVRIKWEMDWINRTINILLK